MSEEHHDAAPGEEHPGDEEQKASEDSEETSELPADELMNDEDGPEVLDESEIKGEAIEGDGSPEILDKIEIKDEGIEWNGSLDILDENEVKGLGVDDDGSPEVLDESEIKGLSIEDDSLFESDGDLDEIFSAMEDVKKDEAKAVAKALTAIETGEANAKDALSSLSADVALKIQQQLDKRSAAEEKTFVSEEDFIKYTMEKQAPSKTWYHCLYFLAFNSEDGTANKKVLYDALKEVLSKSPVDPMPEHMFNFGLSALVKIQLYDAPVVKFKAGTFTLQVKRKKMQDLLIAIGRPLSRRPVVTKKEEKKMINDFFGDL